jgi:hypothetical protein
MATAGYYRNGVTAICDVAWTVNSEVAQLDEKTRHLEVTSAGVLIRTALPITDNWELDSCRTGWGKGIGGETVLLVVNEALVR